MRDGRGSGQRPNSHMYLYQEDATPATRGHFRDPKRERGLNTMEKEGEGEKKRPLRASRDALRRESNDSGNSIPVASQDTVA